VGRVADGERGPFVTDLTKIPLPPGIPAELRFTLQLWQVEVLAAVDARNAQWAGASGYIANPDGTITLKAGAAIDGRSGSSLPTMLSKIANAGKALNQTFLPTVSVSNRLSAQNTDPLTSTSDASVSTITVASHTVQYGAGLVSYTGGSITGLTPDTTYYVYGEDENLTGGAVAYSATTNPQTVVAGNNRYYVGAIRTAKNAATANVSAATQANPCAVTTSAAHGYSSGDTVTFASVGGMTELNSLPATTIVVTGASSFTLTGVNSSAYGAYTSGGTVTRANTTNTDGGLGGGWDWGGALP